MANEQVQCGTCFGSVRERCDEIFSVHKAAMNVMTVFGHTLAKEVGYSVEQNEIIDIAAATNDDYLRGLQNMLSVELDCGLRQDEILVKLDGIEIDG